MSITDFLITIVGKTDGWVIVVIFAMYIGLHCYKKHKEGETILKTLSILEKTIADLLGRIEKSTNTLTSSIDSLMRKS